MFVLKDGLPKAYRFIIPSRCGSTVIILSQNRSTTKLQEQLHSCDPPQNKIPKTDDDDGIEPDVELDSNDDEVVEVIDISWFRQKNPDTLNESQHRIEICEISDDASWIVILDNEKTLYVLHEIAYSKWTLKYAVRTKLRIAHLSIARRRYLLVTDKEGYVYVRYVDGTASVPLIKILGHCSCITDTLLSPRTDLIFTCDRNSKIRCSRFPEAHNIKSYFLCHKAAILGIVLIDCETKLLSMSTDGDIILWDISSATSIWQWNVYNSTKFPYKQESNPKLQFSSWKVDDIRTAVMIALPIASLNRILILQIKMRVFEIHFVEEIEMGQCAWYNGTIYNYIEGSQGMLIKRYSLDSTGTLIADSSFTKSISI